MDISTIQQQTADERKAHARHIRRDWYMKNREEHKARALERYYENQEENKARNRLRAQQRKARLETLEASLRQRALDVEELEKENAALKTILDGRESNTDNHIPDIICV
jgi:hypothetical protein